MRTPAQMLDRLSLQARVWLVIVLVIAGLAALTVVSAVETRKQQMATLTTDLANHVASAVAIADSFEQRAKAGEFDDAEARKRALAAIQSMRWDQGTGYLFAFGSGAPGSTVSYSVGTTQVGTAGATVALSVSGLPSGVTGSFSPASVSAGASSTLTLTLSSSAAAATTSFTVKGTSGSESHTATGLLSPPYLKALPTRFSTMRVTACALQRPGRGPAVCSSSRPPCSMQQAFDRLGHHLREVLRLDPQRQRLARAQPAHVE